MSTLDQQVLQRILEIHAGGDYQAVYMPKVYHHITSYLLAVWGIEKYQSSRDCVESIVDKVCEFNRDYELNKITLEQAHLIILAVVDSVLIDSNLIRSFTNRLQCGEALFPDQQNTFSEWLKDYCEASKEVVKEVRSGLIHEFDEIDNNLARVDHNIGIYYHKLDVTERIRQLSTDR